MLVLAIGLVVEFLINGCFFWRLDCNIMAEGQIDVVQRQG